MNYKMINEFTENDKYKKVIQKELLKIDNSFCPFQKERQMDYLFSFLEKDFINNKNLNILDACCGYGRLIHFLSEFNNNQNYFGIDYVESLINDAKNRFSNFNNIGFGVENVLDLPSKFYKYFDISINYKTMSWLPYYENIIEQLFKVTKNKIYITSLFYDGDIDFIVKIYKDASLNNGDFTYLNTYSLPKFKNYCNNLGAKHINSIDMNLDFDIKKNNDINILSTYTNMLKSDFRLEITGVSILNWKLIEIAL